MHTEPTITMGPYDPIPCPSLDINRIPDMPISQSSAPPEWLGTPMEMMADAFGMDSPWRHGQRNWDRHKRNMQKRRDKRNKAAKAARKRNRK